MTQFQITPSQLKGAITIPPSKSHTLRAILFGLMGKGKTVVHDYLHSPDTFAMIEAIRLLGAEVTLDLKQIVIAGVNGQLEQKDNLIDVGNSGLVFRLIGALAGLSTHETTLTGDHSIRHNRPVQPLLSGLRQLGAFATCLGLDGYAPIKIKGPIHPGTITIAGEDSQPISGLLIATSFLKGPSEIFVTNPGEKPWIDLTLHWMKQLGLGVAHTDHTHYHIAGHGSYDGFEITIPGDFSSAAFPIAAALVTGSELTIHNLNMHEPQGDKQLIDTLIQMGASIDIDHSAHQLTIKPGSPLQGMQLDINDYIDAIPILAVLGCYAKGTTHITNAAIARNKESDRITSICTELKKMGALIEETSDGLIVSHSPLQGAHLNSHADHRIAMALSVAALGATTSSIIDGVACVAKTFPNFAHDLKRLGAYIQVIS